MIQTVVIVAGGNVDIEYTRGFIKEQDESSLLIIACDKGYEACEAMGIKPDIVVGDFDSASSGIVERAKACGAQVIKLNPVKDDTDTEAALDIAISKTDSRDEIYLFGCTGSRIDHVMGNIALVGKGLKSDRIVIIKDPNNHIEMIVPGETYELDKADQFGKYVSVFPYMGPVTGLKMKGFKYPLDGVTLEGFNTLTVSNELAGNCGSITIDSGYLIVMQTKD